MDLTALTTPLDLLDDTTRRALRDHGGPYQVYLAGWRGADNLPDKSCLAFRVADQSPDEAR